MIAELNPCLLDKSMDKFSIYYIDFFQMSLKNQTVFDQQIVWIMYSLWV